MPQFSFFKLSLVASIGSGIEYYNYITYILQALVLSVVFFPPGHPTIALLQTLAVFASGYVTVPLGGLLFGKLGDQWGRKIAFQFSIILMSVATLAIGLLPTYQRVGALAPVLLVILRLLQGIAQGGELPGAITLVSEHVPLKQRGLQNGILFLGVSLGAMLGTAVNSLLLMVFSPADFSSYAWRLTFLIAGALGFLGYVLRKQVQESPLFLAEPQRMQWSLALFRPYGRRLVIGIGLVWFAAGLVTFGLFLPSYAQREFGYAAHTSLMAMTWGFFIAALFLPLFGLLSDRIGRRRQLGWATIIFGLSLYPLFWLLKERATWAIYVFNTLYYLGIVAMASCYPVMLVELFPTQVRYSAVAFCYTGCYALAGFTPLVVTWLNHLTHSPFMGLSLLLVMATMTAVAILKYPVFLNLSKSS